MAFRFTNASKRLYGGYINDIKKVYGWYKKKGTAPLGTAPKTKKAPTFAGQGFNKYNSYE